MQSDTIVLTLSCAELDDSRTDALARDMAQSLREEGLKAAIAGEAVAALGQKGDAVTIGAIVLALIQTGGVAGKLVDVLRAYVARQSMLRFELMRPNGEKLSLDASWFGAANLEQTRELLADLCRR